MQKNNLLVSIFCPTYNHSNYIEQCLNGIVMQKTNFQFEVIVQDDASTDNSQKIIKEFAEKYNFIVPVLHTKNIYSKGGDLNEYFFRNASGKYIAICEGDDYWTDPYKLQKQVDFLEANSDFSLCFHDALILWDDKSHPPKYFCTKDQKEVSTIEDVIEKWFIPTASFVFRKEHILPLPEWFSKIYNGDYCLQLLLANRGKIGYIDEVMSVYRRQPGSLSYNPKINREFYEKQMTNLLRYFDNYTDEKYHALILKKINSIIKESKIYFLKKDYPLIYHLKNPLLTFGKILRDVGLYIISKRVK